MSIGGLAAELSYLFLLRPYNSEGAFQFELQLFDIFLKLLGSLDFLPDIFEFLQYGSLPGKNALKLLQQMLIPSRSHD